MVSGFATPGVLIYLGKTLFAQIMDFVPRTSFRRIVTRYGGDRRVRALNCADQFRVLAFPQLTWRESLRDIEVCLSAQGKNLLGFREAVARSALADVNASRKWRIWHDLAKLKLAQLNSGIRLDNLAPRLASDPRYVSIAAAQLRPTQFLYRFPRCKLMAEAVPVAIKWPKIKLTSVQAVMRCKDRLELDNPIPHSPPSVDKVL